MGVVFLFLHSVFILSVITPLNMPQIFGLKIHLTKKKNHHTLYDHFFWNLNSYWHLVYWNREALTKDDRGLQWGSYHLVLKGSR